ncbi:MAG: hypothetical protein M3P18_26445 [Actinomycetota bacterium]|nr:hypothetical protein [Actinomycetota bacterium]
MTDDIARRIIDAAPADILKAIRRYSRRTCNVRHQSSGLILATHPFQLFWRFTWLLSRVRGKTEVTLMASTRWHPMPLLAPPSRDLGRALRYALATVAKESEAHQPSL